MDREIGSVSLLTRIRMMLFVVWAISSTIVYGSLAMVLGGIHKWTTREIGRVWSRHLLFVGGVKVRVTGAEKLDKSQRYVFVSNHQSALDIPILMSGIINQLSFIAKKELFYIPVFGWGMYASGHIWIDRSNARKARMSIDRALKRLEKEKVSLIIFPEGTRSPDGNVQDFKQASFTLAIEAKTKLIPVAICNANHRLPKKSSEIRPGYADLIICDPIDMAGLKTTDKGELSKKVQGIIKEAVSKYQK